MKRIIAIFICLSFFAISTSILTGCAAANVALVGSRIGAGVSSKSNDDAGPKHWNPGVKRYNR